MGVVLLSNRAATHVVAGRFAAVLIDGQAAKQFEVGKHLARAGDD